MAGSPVVPSNPLTPRLNAALEMVMHDKRADERVRVWAAIARTSWGNWCPYACQRPVPPIELPAQAESEIRAFAFGAGPCPFCRRSVKPDPDLPRNWRWHDRCMAVAYAEDAARYGSAREQEWARGVLTGGAL